MCKSGCCSTTSSNYKGYVDSYNYSGYYLPAGVFICENYASACGWGPVAEGEVNIIGIITGVIIFVVF